MNRIYSIIITIFICINVNAQTPQGVNYQGVARNTAGAELVNQNIGIQISVLNGSSTGTVVYTETHSATTNANGLFTLMIGGGTPVTGTFAGIDWSTGGGKWLQISMDVSGGSSYVLMGTSQLLSVPYAQYAGKVANYGGKSILILTDAVTDAQAATIIANEVGPNTHEIIITDCSNLTTVDLSSVTTVTSVQVLDNPLLTTVNLNGLKRSFGKISFINCPALSSVNLPSLKKISDDGLFVENTGAVSISAPLLTTFAGDLYIYNNLSATSVSFPLITQCNKLEINSADALISLDLSSFTTSNKFIISYCIVLPTLSLPNLTSPGTFEVSYGPALTSLNFPLISSCASISINDNSVTSISLPSLSFYMGGINIGNNKLPVSEVDAWLAKAQTYDLMNSGAITYFNSSGQTPPAPPSTAGQSSASFLQGQGALVITD